MTTRVRLSIDLVLPESVTAGEWAATLGQALDVLNNVAAHPPVVRAAFLEPAREVTLRDVLHAELDAADLAARNKLAALSEIARGTETGDAIVEALTAPEPVLSTREQAEAAERARGVVDAAAICRCSHAFDRHDRIGGSEQRRGACAAYGCRCGIWRPVTLVQGTGNVAATADNDCHKGG